MHGNEDSEADKVGAFSNSNVTDSKEQTKTNMQKDRLLIRCIRVTVDI